MTVRNAARPASLRRSKPPFRPAGALLLCVIVSAICVTPVSAQQAVDFNIPSQDLSSAVLIFAQRAKVRVFYDTTRLRGRQAPAVTGLMSPQDALDRLLAGSGLNYRFTSPNAVTIGSTQNSDVSGAAPGSIPLDVIDVQGTATSATTEGTNSYGSPRVSMTKDGATIKETPQSISVVTRKRIEDQNLTTLDKAVANTTGIVVQQGDSDRPYYYSRGFPINIFQLDGVPTSISISASAQDLAMYDRVEVLRGPSGLLNGFGSPGGTFNLVRKKPKSEFELSNTISAGSYDYIRNVFDITGPLNAAKTVRGRLVGTLQSQNFIEDSAYRRLGQIYGVIEGDVSDSAVVRFGAYYQESPARQPWSGVPATTQYKFVDAPRSTFFGAPWNKNIYTQTGAFGELEQNFDNGWKSKASLNYARYESDITSSNFLGQINPTTLTGTFASTHWNQDDQQVGFDWYMNGPLLLFGREHKLTFGVNASREDFEQRNFYGPLANRFYLQTRNIFDLNFPQPAFDGPIFGRHTYTDQFSAYANARISLIDRLTLVLGGRMLWWNNEFRPNSDENFLNQKATNDTINAKPIPFAGLVYDIDKTYSAYVSYSQIFQPQTQRDVAANLLKPVEGEQYEAGIKASYFDDRLIATLAFYSLTQQNRAMLNPNDPSNTVYFAQGKARSQGVEAELSGRITDRWNVFAGYTYTETENLDDSLNVGGVAFSTIAPKHLFKLWTAYNLPFDMDRWTIGGGVYATSSFYTEDLNGRLVAPGYATASTAISYRINEHFTASFSVENLFNKTYIRSLTGTTNGFYGDPRTYLVKMQAKW